MRTKRNPYKQFFNDSSETSAPSPTCKLGSVAPPKSLSWKPPMPLPWHQGPVSDSTTSQPYGISHLYTCFIIFPLHNFQIMVQRNPWRGPAATKPWRCWPRSQPYVLPLTLQWTRPCDASATRQGETVIGENMSWKPMSTFFIDDLFGSTMMGVCWLAPCR